MHRRQFLESVALAGTVSPVLLTTTLARQSGTPGATPVFEEEGPDFGPTLEERVAQVAPETLLETLRTTPVTTPLFPSDTPPIEPVIWEEFGDTDLEGTLGGVVFSTGYDENDNFLGVGAAVVHPDAASASRAATIQEPGTESGGTLLGSPILFYQNIDYGLVSVQADYLIIGGNALAPVEGSGDQPTLLLRSVAYTAALLDHLDGVLTDLGV